MFTLHIKADRDRNGNPRRCFAVFGVGPKGVTLAGVYDEGLEGRNAIPQHFQDRGALDHIREIKASVGEYRRWLKMDPGHDGYNSYSDNGERAFPQPGRTR